MSQPIIDAHVHCYPDHLAPRALAAVQTSMNYRQTDGTIVSQKRWMAAHGVVQAIALNMAGRPETMEHVNQFARSMSGQEQRLGKLVPFGSVHPLAKNAQEEVEKLYNAGIRGIKFHTGHQEFDFADPIYFPLYRKIGELGMITLVHCGPSAKSNAYLVWPSTVARAIEAFNGAPFICAHMGGINYMHPEFAVLQELPVFVDTALATRYMNSEQFAQMVSLLGVHRVLFGSDLPWGDYAETMDLVEHAPLTEEEKRAILFGNAYNLIQNKYF